MTTREYQEAYDDDSDRVRAWPAQDAQEPPSDVAYLWAEIERLRVRANLMELQRDYARFLHSEHHPALDTTP